MRTFVDTGAFLALEIENDQNHAAAEQTFVGLKDKRALFFTNDYVLVESYTRLIYDVHLKAAQKFHEYITTLIDKNQLILLDVTPTDRNQAWQELKRYSDHKLSFTDATIIVNFKNYHLEEIFTFDKHFKTLKLPASNL